MNLNETLYLLSKRRSVRAYDGTPISESERGRIADAALRAPTAGNLMLYSIIEIEDQAIKDALAVSCDNQPFIATAPMVWLFAADYQRWMDLFETGRAFAMPGLNHRKPGCAELMLACSDALIAAQNAVIAAESMGIGSCYIGDIMEQFERHRDLLALPQYTFPIAMLCFGRAKPGATKYTPRLEQSVIIHKNKYHRMDQDECDKLMAGIAEASGTTSFPPGVENVAQDIYKRKFTADFTHEMDRSIQAWIKRWCGEE